MRNPTKSDILIGLGIYLFIISLLDLLISIPYINTIEQNPFLKNKPLLAIIGKGLLFPFTMIFAVSQSKKEINMNINLIVFSILILAYDTLNFLNMVYIIRFVI